MVVCKNSIFDDKYTQNTIVAVQCTHEQAHTCNKLGQLNSSRFVDKTFVHLLKKFNNTENLRSSYLHWTATGIWHDISLPNTSMLVFTEVFALPVQGLVAQLNWQSLVLRNLSTNIMNRALIGASRVILNIREVCGNFRGSFFNL